MTIKINVYKNDREAFINACNNMDSKFEYQEKEQIDGNYEYIVFYNSRLDLFALGQYFGIELRKSKNWETR